MTAYYLMERDFIERTLAVIDQYEEFVRGRVGHDQEYEVTLLMNCLLGLLIYPQQIATQDQRVWNRWLTDKHITDIGDNWGLHPHFVKSAGYTNDNKPICVKDLTLRNLVRQMRNTASHACFRVNEGGAKPGTIRTIEFEDESREHGFHLELPVENLGEFVCRLAQSALDNISDPRTSRRA